MNPYAPFIAISLLASLSASEIPKAFSGFFEQDVPVKGQIGVILPPPEIDKYVAKVEAAAHKDPKWFREYSNQAKAGAPLPFDERLGITQTEYREYLALWDKRAFKPMEEVMLLLRQSASNSWSLTATGSASTFSTLRYNPKDDQFRSPNGVMKRIADITADSESILGAWTGQEWKFEEDTGLGKIKENFALGRLAGNQYGLIVYRAQELSSEGTRLLDKSLIVRFAINKSGPTTKAVPTATPATKPTAKPVAKSPPKSASKTAAKP
jgi:hypothetical protein